MTTSQENFSATRTGPSESTGARTDGGVAADTAARSLAHWSEAGRAEMEAFYALATEDYHQLALARDWAGDLEGLQDSEKPLQLLDVACGSGKFPKALLRDTAIAGVDGLSVDYHLLDPSTFSISEAKAQLAPPFIPAGEHAVTLQDFTVMEPFDVVWATHALYALPPAELEAGLRVYLEALRPGGFAAIGHAREASHYLAFYRPYLETHGGTPYTSAEQIIAALRALGVEPDVQELVYTTSAAATGDTSVAEGFLQRCLFDSQVSLADMLAEPGMGAYLSGCREGDRYVFGHQVALITWSAP